MKNDGLLKNRISVVRASREMARLMRNLIQYPIEFAGELPLPLPKDGHIIQKHIDCDLENGKLLEETIDDFSENTLMPMAQYLIADLGKLKINRFYDLLLPSNPPEGSQWSRVQYDGLSIRAMIGWRQNNEEGPLEQLILRFDVMGMATRGLAFPKSHASLGGT